MSTTLVKPVEKRASVRIRQQCFGCYQWVVFDVLTARTAKAEFHYTTLGKPCERNDNIVAILESHKKLGS